MTVYRENLIHVQQKRVYGGYSDQYEHFNNVVMELYVHNLRSVWRKDQSKIIKTSDCPFARDRNNNST